MNTCPECRGSGVYQEYDEYDRYFLHSCATCDGSGELKEKYERKSKMIIASALKITKDDKEFVIMGKRHSDCAETLYNAGVKRPFQCIEGFVNDQFEFLDRLQAWDEADHYEQIIPYSDEDTPSPGMLFSEDLW